MQSFNYALEHKTCAAQEMKFSIKFFFSKCDQIQFPADLVTFTEEILNEKIHFLCSVNKMLKTYLCNICFLWI